MRALVFLISVLFFVSCGKGIVEPIEKASEFTDNMLQVELALPDEYIIYNSYEELPDYLKKNYENNKGFRDAIQFIAVDPAHGTSVSCFIVKSDVDLKDHFKNSYIKIKQTVKVNSAKYSEIDDSIQWVYHTKTGPFEITVMETMAKYRGSLIALTFTSPSTMYDNHHTKFQEYTQRFKVIYNNEWLNIWRDIESKLSKKDFAYVDIHTPDTVNDVSLYPCNPDDHPLLWRVDENSSTVYLFGSIHYGKQELYPLPSIIENAFAESDSLIVELNIKSKEFAANASKLLKAGQLPNGKKLPDVLSPSVYRKLEQRFDILGLPIDNFLTFKPWLMTLSLTSFQMLDSGFHPDLGVDAYFLNRAIREKKTIYELETVDDQIGVFDNVDGELFLAYTLLSLNTFEVDVTKLIKAWRCGDQQNIQGLLHETFSNQISGGDNLLKKILFNRNEKMTKKIIDQYLKTNTTHFLVVGAGHLVGERSIIDLLINAGYEVKRL